MHRDPPCGLMRGATKAAIRCRDSTETVSPIWAHRFGLLARWVTSRGFGYYWAALTINVLIPELLTSVYTPGKPAFAHPRP